MVHRSNDTRLLTSLIKSERDYTTSLNSVLMHSYTSSASLKAYASASSPSMGNIIISIAGLFAAADDALKKYVASVEAWREELKEIKELEDELGVVLRDREILVTRLVKVTKQKPPTAPPPSTGYSRFGGGQPETKLSLAQAELQACEAHLAGMESELEVRRRRALRNGLEARCKALVDCGWVWGEKGKDGLRKLHSIGVENGSNGTVEAPDFPYSPSLPLNNFELSSSVSLAPSQSASQIGHGSNSNHLKPPSSSNHTREGSSQQHSYFQTLSKSHSGHSVSPSAHAYKLAIPPAHAIQDGDLMPSASVEDHGNGEEGSGTSEAGPLEVHENNFHIRPVDVGRTNGNGVASGSATGSGGGRADGPSTRGHHHHNNNHSNMNGGFGGMPGSGMPQRPYLDKPTPPTPPSEPIAVPAPYSHVKFPSISSATASAVASVGAGSGVSNNSGAAGPSTSRALHNGHAAHNGTNGINRANGTNGNNGHVPHSPLNPQSPRSLHNPHNLNLEPLKVPSGTSLSAQIGRMMVPSPVSASPINYQPEIPGEGDYMQQGSRGRERERGRERDRDREQMGMGEEPQWRVPRRKRSKSLFGGIGRFFKGAGSGDKRADSVSPRKQSFSAPWTGTDGWETRIDQNIKDIQQSERRGNGVNGVNGGGGQDGYRGFAGRDESSSDEEEQRPVVVVENKRRPSMSGNRDFGPFPAPPTRQSGNRTRQQSESPRESKKSEYRMTPPTSPSKSLKRNAKGASPLATGAAGGGDFVLSPVSAPMKLKKYHKGGEEGRYGGDEVDHHHTGDTAGRSNKGADLSRKSTERTVKVSSATAPPVGASAGGVRKRRSKKDGLGRSGSTRSAATAPPGRLVLTGDPNTEQATSTWIHNLTESTNPPTTTATSSAAPVTRSATSASRRQKGIASIPDPLPRLELAKAPTNVSQLPVLHYPPPPPDPPHHSKSTSSPALGRAASKANKKYLRAKSQLVLPSDLPMPRSSMSPPPVPMPLARSPLMNGAPEDLPPPPKPLRSALRNPAPPPAAAPSAPLPPPPALAPAFTPALAPAQHNFSGHAQSVTPTPQQGRQSPNSRPVSADSTNESEYASAYESGEDGIYDEYMREDEGPERADPAEETDAHGTPMQRPNGGILRNSHYSILPPAAAAPVVESNMSSLSSTASPGTDLPSRRKSVRLDVPPSADSTPGRKRVDEDPIHEYTRHPHSTIGSALLESDTTGWASRINETRADRWDDSSEEDEEYARARRALDEAKRALQGVGSSKAEKRNGGEWRTGKNKRGW